MEIERIHQHLVSVHLTGSKKTKSTDGRTTYDGRPRHDSSSAVQSHKAELIKLANIDWYQFLNKDPPSQDILQHPLLSG